ncbi:hypothetical protein [Trichoplusia ni ascovirus 6b]|nr:hypothetical protein [Trichoplusia ni ascovirus 6b]
MVTTLRIPYPQSSYQCEDCDNNTDECINCGTCYSKKCAKLCKQQKWRRYSRSLCSNKNCMCLDNDDNCLNC